MPAVAAVPCYTPPPTAVQNNDGLLLRNPHFAIGKLKVVALLDRTLENGNRDRRVSLHHRQDDGSHQAAVQLIVVSRHRRSNARVLPEGNPNAPRASIRRVLAPAMILRFVRLDNPVLSIPPYAVILYCSLDGFPVAHPMADSDLCPPPPRSCCNRCSSLHSTDRSMPLRLDQAAEKSMARPPPLESEAVPGG
ncbi:hypothetical protein PIB30_050755 [Stylosanthes scabra]|uniref:Uncharacterized protein n=1 Tax=Stylosanthes scabra TaxID=79078 RepID=A0ABU6THH1_9FABA|nr:hypothetical protein [Stylosanthes scabra]